MSYLQVIPKASEHYDQGYLAEIRVRPDGHLVIDCEDDWTYEWLVSLLTERLFVQGQGFPTFKRDSEGHLEREVETRRYILTGFVGLNEATDEVLKAIVDNLEATEQFEITWKS